MKTTDKIDLKTHLDLVASKDQIISDLEKDVQYYRETIRLMKLKQFGKRSEKLPNHPDLFEQTFNEIEHWADEDDDSVVEEDSKTEPKKTTKSKKGRKRLPSELPRIKVVIDFPESERQCEQGHKTEVLEEIISEELDIIPAKVQVIQKIRLKRICTICPNRPIKTAPIPEKLLPKTQCSDTLLAFIITAKFCDGLPFYRQMGILKRYGIETLTRATLANWAIKASEKMIPLMNLMRDHLLEGSVIWMDETRIQVLKEIDRKAESKSQMWVQVGGDPKRRVVLFEYDPSRSGEVAKRLLDTYSGCLQTDGYPVYDSVAEANGLTLSGCWDHARRKFFDAKKAEKGIPKKKNSVSKADIALSFISKLYAIERTLEDASVEQIKKVRQEKSVPVLEKIRSWLDKQLPKIVPKSALGKALFYLDNQWPYLVAYCEDGHFRISNCLAENAIRPFAVGRKAWLFANSTRGAKASAIFYSLVETAKLNNLEPYAYLRAVFENLPKATCVEDFEKLLPWNIQIP